MATIRSRDFKCVRLNTNGVYYVTNKSCEAYALHYSIYDRLTDKPIIGECWKADGDYYWYTKTVCTAHIYTKEQRDNILNGGTGETSTEQPVDPNPNTDNSGIQIDSGLYTTITSFLLLSFVTGHITGRIVKTLNKA
ncbi:hypothetical protein MACH09_41620 [Vibrio sp. MACH09]|uniref:hypothetical protein n=1 Tax=Vibrio sp. MACH09 TaxID=3025122 RepID=UPI002794685F|nr:hypothetical protein [Vibrio sp. MACH09]GLO63654.1 hypothetical protein MACH09_41620 [Vibrio sp. MACH09]